MKAKILHSQNGSINFSFAMQTIRDHPHAMSCPYFWKSSLSEHKEVKLLCCNEFPNECAVSVSRDNQHSSQKKDFYFSSFLILADHNALIALHHFLISASFSITAERANICKHFAHTFRTHFDRIQFFFANVAINSYIYRKRAYGAPIWSQSVRFIANEFIANVSVVLFSRQWPEVYDSCHTFWNACNSRMSVCFLTRATCKNVRQNLIPRATA